MFRIKFIKKIIELSQYKVKNKKCKMIIFIKYKKLNPSIALKNKTKKIINSIILPKPIVNTKKNQIISTMKTNLILIVKLKKIILNHFKKIKILN